MPIKATGEDIVLNLIRDERVGFGFQTLNLPNITSSTLLY
jgi:hypothetical protein